MKIIKMNCTNCNAPLEVEEGQKTINCKYCHTTNYIDDEAIEFKHTIYSGEKEEKFKNAATLLKLQAYDDAFKQYKILSNEYAYEPETWYSMVICLTADFTNFHLNESNINACDDYMNKYKQLESEEKLKIDRLKKYESYQKQVKDNLNTEKKEKKEFEVINKKAIRIVYAMLAFLIFVFGIAIFNNIIIVLLLLLGFIIFIETIIKFIYK